VRGFHGTVTTEHGTVFVDGEGPPTDRDMDTIADFQRYLRVAPPGTRGGLWLIPGWVPYALGIGPAPPKGFDYTPITAMPFPG
jgi:hypothetical protein